MRKISKTNGQGNLLMEMFLIEMLRLEYELLIFLIYFFLCKCKLSNWLQQNDDAGH